VPGRTIFSGQGLCSGIRSSENDQDIENNGKLGDEGELGGEGELGYHGDHGGLDTYESNQTEKEEKWETQSDLSTTACSDCANF
jgi:hypothetical protein